MLQTATLPHDRAASVARLSSSWATRFRTWRQGLRLRPPMTADEPLDANRAALATSDFWPLIARAAQPADTRMGAAALQALCELRGSPPGQPLLVQAAESELHALLAHLSAISRQVLGGQVLPQATARVELGHAVLHWGESSRAEDGMQLARVFTRLSSLPAAPTPANAALHHSVQGALRIVQACGGRLYPSASPLALMRLTARLPLVRPGTPVHEVQA